MMDFSECQKKGNHFEVDIIFKMKSWSQHDRYIRTLAYFHLKRTYCFEKQSETKYFKTHYTVSFTWLKVVICSSCFLKTKFSLQFQYITVNMWWDYYKYNRLLFNLSNNNQNSAQSLSVSDSLWPPGLQHSRLLCPSPAPGTSSNSCPSSWWYHSAISSSVVPFSSCPQSLPGSASFQMSQLFPSGGQSIGVSASASVLPIYIQD